MRRRLNQDEVPPEHFGAAIGESRAKHLPRRLLEGGWIKVRRRQVNHRNSPTRCEPCVRHIDHARPRLRGELTQHERHHHKSGGRTLWTSVKRTRMQVCGEAVGDQPAARSLQAIFARVVGARIAARGEEHRPESDPSTKLHDASAVLQCIEPEYGAIKLPLPRCATKWPAIVWRTIQVPRLEFVRVLRWRQESKSCWHPALANLRCASSDRRWRRWREWNADRWLNTFGASAQALF